MLAHSKWPLMTYSRRTACSLVSQEYLYFTFSFVFGFHCVRWMDVCLIHTALPCQPHEPRHLRSICEGVNSGSVWSPLESGCSKCKNLVRDLKGWGDYFVLLINTVVVEFCFHVLSLLLPANNPIDDSATLTTAVMNPHGSIFFFQRSNLFAFALGGIWAEHCCAFGDSWNNSASLPSSATSPLSC